METLLSPRKDAQAPSDDPVRAGQNTTKTSIHLGTYDYLIIHITINGYAKKKKKTTEYFFKEPTKK